MEVNQAYIDFSQYVGLMGLMIWAIRQEWNKRQ